jgi:hypothetical protein
VHIAHGGFKHVDARRCGLAHGQVRRVTGLRDGKGISRAKVV